MKITEIPDATQLSQRVIYIDFNNCEKLKFIIKALIERRPLWIVYRSIEGKVSVREIFPEKLEVTYSGKFIVKGFCVLRNEERSFLVERMLDVRLIECLSDEEEERLLEEESKYYKYTNY